jgi:DNA (cytosine-5)-methyltransferase 1
MLIADLESFEIYRSPDSGYEGRRLELISLHYLEVPNPKKLCFDGFLCLGNVKHFVQGLTIQDSSIEDYGNDESPGVVAFVRSESASKDSDYDIWFRLKTPTEAYKRFHDPFMWVAQLAKHVLDFMEEQPERSVGLRSFHDVFQQWLLSRFGQDPVYQIWHVPFHNQTDFRVAVNAYIEFLYHQAFNLPNSKSLLKHPLWADCMARGLTAIKKQPQLVDYTLATPAVYRNFKDLYFGEKIRPMRISDAVRNQQDRRKRELGFQVNDPPLEQSSPICQPYGTSPIKVGDVVAFDPDKEDQQLWRDANWEWLAYVQSIELLSSGVQRLFVLYVYRPRETNIFKAKYPFENELFFSDNCNCTEGHLLSTDVNGKYEIDWMPSTIKSTTGFFIRQTYVTQESAFLTFKEEHKTCICRKRNSSATSVSYHPGDTVYMTKTVGGHKILEPVVIRHIDKMTGATTVRKLLRLSRDCAQLAEEAKRDGKSAANELVLTDDYEMVPASRIQRRCHIRFVKKQDVLRNCIPFPYNRGGAGDLWFLSMGIITTSNNTPRLVFLSRMPDKFNEGPDMAASINAAKLLGLSIFSGGGNLDRGLEEGGAVEFRTAVDLDAQAIHTQRANAKDPSQLKLFYGSVDDFLKAALLGQEHPLVARIGEVNFIAAGSPCPGTSFVHVADVRSSRLIA